MPCKSRRLRWQKKQKQSAKFDFLYLYLIILQQAQDKFRCYGIFAVVFV